MPRASTSIRGEKPAGCTFLGESESIPARNLGSLGSFSRAIRHSLSTIRSSCDSLFPLILAGLCATPHSDQEWAFDSAATPRSLSQVSLGSVHQPTGNQLASVARVTIIESTSANTGHTQDPAWASVAAAEGFVAGIYPQSTLETTAFFGTSDILVISSGMIGLTATAASSIDAFLISQRP